MCLRSILLSAVILATPHLAMAQGAEIGFGGTEHDSSLPVEITADQLDVDQNAGTAKFTGNVVVGQGDMRLTGAVVDVEYGEGSDGATEVRTVVATGDVTLFNGAEAAEGEQAVYTLDSGVVVMTGDVVLTQGENAMAGEKLTVNLETGTGLMEGRVRVVFTNDSAPEANQ